MHAFDSGTNIMLALKLLETEKSTSLLDMELNDLDDSDNEPDYDVNKDAQNEDSESDDNNSYTSLPVGVSSPVSMSIPVQPAVSPTSAKQVAFLRIRKRKVNKASWRSIGQSVVGNSGSRCKRRGTVSEGKMDPRCYYKCTIFTEEQ